MKILFVLLELTHSEQLTLGFGTVVVFFGLLIWRAIYLNKKRKNEILAELEFLERKDTPEEIHPDVQELISTPEPDEFIVDEKDTNLFINAKNPDFKIRKKSGKMDSRNDENWRDKYKFSLSNAHIFEEADEIFVLAEIQGLTEVEYDRTHELVFVKSSAVEWSDLEPAIVKFLFLYLHKVYGWKNETQLVCISPCPNPEAFSFSLRLETKYHLDLGKRLLSIQGIKRDHNFGGFPICMNHSGTYDFILSKACAFSWDELLPKIKEVFTNYFVGGVEFKNISKYSESELDNIRNFERTYG